MFNIPKVTKNLLIINVIAFLATMVFGRNLMLELHFFLDPNFHIYQLFTYMFLHADILHILFNMFALWMFGCVVENVLGQKKFLIFYVVCGIGAGLFQEIAQFAELFLSVDPKLGTTVGASGATFGILLAFGMLFPEQRIFIFPFPVPIKAKWFVVLYAALEIFQTIKISNDGVAHLAHLGGMAFGYIMIRYWRRHPGSGYGMDSGMQFFDNMRASWERRRANRSTGYRNDAGRSSVNSNADWDYNARKKAEQEEIDRILDKIRRNGYDSLTKEEKQKLFDSSNRK